MKFCSETRTSSEALALALNQGSDSAWRHPVFRKSSDFRYGDSAMNKKTDAEAPVPYC